MYTPTFGLPPLTRLSGQAAGPHPWGHCPNMELQSNEKAQVEMIHTGGYQIWSHQISGKSFLRRRCWLLLNRTQYLYPTQANGARKFSIIGSMRKNAKV